MQVLRSYVSQVQWNFFSPNWIGGGMYLLDFEHPTKYFQSPTGILLLFFLHLCISTNVNLPKEQDLLRCPE